MKKIKLYGTTWCPDCQKSKKLLGEYMVDYEFIDIDKDPKAAEYVEEVNQGSRTIPTIILTDGRVLVEPSNEELKAALNLTSDTKEEYTDLLIIGAGPTGLAAAIYTTREGIDTTMLEKKIPGGQAAVTDQIENYPGFPDGVSGLHLAESLVKQAEKFGTKIVSAEVVSITDKGLYNEVKTLSQEFRSKAVLIAVGSEYKKSGAIGEDKLIGRGVHFCATCDGPFYRNKSVAVIGGGNSALQEAIFLTKFASHVTVLIRGDKAKASEVLIKKTEEMSDKITLMYNTSVAEFVGDRTLETVKIKNAQTNEITNLDVSGVFVFIGLIPQTNFLKDSIELNEHGFVKTDMMLQTNISGVFAAGDCRQGATAQIAAAVGEGATAALMIRQYLEKK